jgi:3'-phosphoadenosine 5'-phosphosulfate sulfotransferase (PAPS reductase)/FAD synthetase
MSENGTMDTATCFDLLDEAYDTHSPALVFALFSGGHDSLCSTRIAQEWGAARGVWVPVATVNTGTGLPRTRKFVIDTVQEHEWSVMEMHPPRSYESLVREMGFPGPGFHDRLAYPRLKERCFRNLARLAPDDRSVMFVSGVREEESLRRTEHVERIQDRGKVIWAAPLWDWTKVDVNRFISGRGMKRNPVVDAIHMSGECLCGTMAKPGELQEIEEWFADDVAWIHRLEDECEALGLRADRWGQRPPKVARDQQKLFLAPNDGSIVPMACMSCAARADVEEEL